MVKGKRVIVQPNKYYIKQLRTWDMYLYRKHSTPPDFLKLSVKGEDIKLRHEYVDTERMTSVLEENFEKLRNSTLLYSNQSTEDLAAQDTEILMSQATFSDSKTE